jgi:hypothetical protein
MDFIYLHEIEQRNLLHLLSVGQGVDQGGRDGASNLINVKYKPIWNCHNEYPMYNEYILIKN